MKEHIKDAAIHLASALSLSFEAMEKQVAELMAANARLTEALAIELAKLTPVSPLVAQPFAATAHKPVLGQPITGRCSSSCEAVDSTNDETLLEQIKQEFKRGYREEGYTFRSPSSIAQKLNIGDVDRVKFCLSVNDHVFRRNSGTKDTYTLRHGIGL